MELESGEYFLAQAERNKRQKASEQAQQADRVAEKKRKRMEAFAPPKVSIDFCQRKLRDLCSLRLVCYGAGCFSIFSSSGLISSLCFRQETSSKAIADVPKAGGSDLAELTQSLKKKSKKGEASCIAC